MPYLFRIFLATLFICSTAHAATSKDWFRYAEYDLHAAELLTDSDESLIGIALYHLEQATEKALKAYLIAQHIPFALTHDLKPLLLSCSQQESSFTAFSTDIATINPYSTKSRYPNNSYSPPSVSTVKELIARVQALLAHVAQKMAHIQVL